MTYLPEGRGNRQRCAVGRGFAEAGPDKLVILTDEYTERERIDPVLVRKELAGSMQSYRNSKSVPLVAMADCQRGRARDARCSRTAPESLIARQNWLAVQLELYGDPPPATQRPYEEYGPPAVPLDEEDRAEPHERGDGATKGRRIERPSSPRVMQRWITTLVGLAVIVLAVWLVTRNARGPKAIGQDITAPSVDTGKDDGGGLLFAYGEAGASDDARPLLLSDLVVPAVRFDGGTSGFLFDGSQVPPLPINAPRQVRFAVVLVSFADAQPSAGASHPIARSRADAKALAERLAAQAAQDFHAAVQAGDPGSSEDVGRVKRGHSRRPGSRIRSFYRCP